MTLYNISRECFAVPVKLQGSAPYGRTEPYVDDPGFEGWKFPAQL